MRSLLSVVVLLFAAAVAAVSTAGSRLLVVLDDVADKDAYKQFLGDLTGEGTAGSCVEAQLRVPELLLTSPDSQRVRCQL